MMINLMVFLLAFVFVIIRCNVTKEDLTVELKGKSEHGSAEVKVL